MILLAPDVDAQRFIPASGQWSVITETPPHPLAQGSTTIVPANQSGTLSAGSPEPAIPLGDRGRFLHRPAGEGDDFRIRLGTATTTGVFGLMVRDKADPGSAFVLVGHNASNETVLVYRQRAGENVVVVPFDPPRAQAWLRVLVGRDTVYVADAAEVVPGTPGSWQFIAAVKIELTGGEPWERRSDLGGVFLSDGSATYSDLFQTEHLYWSERTTKTNSAIQSPPGSWASVAPSAVQFTDSATLLSRNNAGSAAYVDFPLDIKVASYYRLFVHAVAGNQSPIRAALVLNGVQQTIRELDNVPSGLNSWLPLDPGATFYLPTGVTSSIRIFDPGTAGSVVLADAARAVLVPARENGVLSYPGWTRTPQTAANRVTLTDNGLSTNDLRRSSVTPLNAWNAGGQTNHVLIGDGMIRFRFIGSSTRVQAGLTASPGGNDPATITYRFSSASSGQVSALGGGSASFTQNNNDWLEIERIGSQIVFRRNNAQVLYSTAPSSVPLYLDVAFYDEAARVYASRVSGHWIHPTYIDNLDADSHSDAIERWVIDADPEDDLQSIYDVDMNADSDGDGLTNLQEYNLSPRTDPTKADSDEDGMPDGWEVTHGLNPSDANDATGDADNDGASNLIEFQSGTNPTNSDSDDDGLPDGWEILHGLSPTADDADGDKDSDGLSNNTEYSIGSSASNPDTDGDGLTDGSENFTHSTNPLLVDTDSDGLTDPYEVSDSLGFLPNDEDSDDDGLGDWAEWKIITFDANDAVTSQAHVLPGDDFDGDGASNLTETLEGSDPTIPDTDADGMPDGWEIANGLDPVSNDATGDLDGDGLSNFEEYTLGTEPDLDDSDGDGIDDHWEIINLLDPLDEQDAGLDADNDGLSNLEEYTEGSNPHLFSTAGDGFSDGWKKQYGINPSQVLAGTADPDADGLTNAQEHGLLTNPMDDDTDGDGMADGWEVSYGPTYQVPVGATYNFDPANGLDPLTNDANLDPDNDGFSNLQEFQSLTDPHDPGSNSSAIDTDNDGIPDGWEIQFGLNPADDSDSTYDWDYDGLTNLREYEYFAEHGLLMDPRPKWRYIPISDGFPQYGTPADTRLASPIIRSFDWAGNLAKVEFTSGQVEVRKWNSTGPGGNGSWSSNTFAFGPSGTAQSLKLEEIRQNIFGLVAASFSQQVGLGRIWHLRILDQHGNLVQIGVGKSWKSISGLHVTDSGFVVAGIESNVPDAEFSNSSRAVLRWRKGKVEFFPLASSNAFGIQGLSERGETLVDSVGVLGIGRGNWYVPSPKRLAIGSYGNFRLSFRFAGVIPV